MYTLMIADDDPYASTRLSKLIDLSALGYRLLPAARSEEEAQRLRGQHHPDVLLSDIRLLTSDASRSARQATGGSYAVLLDEKHVPQQEVPTDLAKPVTARRLRELLTRLRDVLDGSAQRRWQLAAREAIFCLLDGDATMTVGQWCAEMDNAPELRTCRMCTCQVREAQREALAASLPADAIMLRTGRDKVTILYDSQSRRLPAAELPLPCGVSAVASAESSLLEVYQQSDIAFFTARFFRYAVPVYFQATTADERQQRSVNDIAQALSAGNHVLTKSLLVSLQRKLTHLNAAQVAEVYNQLVEPFCRYVRPEGFSRAPLDYRQLCQQYASLDDLFSAFYRSLEEGSSSGKLQFDEVLRLIDANYTQNLRMSDLAHCFHFSTSYFSTLFRERVGVTFTQYIAQKRIALVKDLLGDESLSLQQIADQAGFCDYFQFSKDFKKHTGTTPGLFRKQLLEQNKAE